MSDNYQLISEKLLEGLNFKEVGEILIKSGIDPFTATKEINEVMCNPIYMGAVKGNSLHVRRFSKLKWMMQTVADHYNLSERSRKINITDDISEADFFENYYFQNKPLLLNDQIKNWKALKEWSPEYLIKKWGNIDVEITDGRESCPEPEMLSPTLKKMTKFGSFIEKCQTVKSSDFYMMANNDNHTALIDMWDDVGRLPCMLDPNGQRAHGFFFIGPCGTIKQCHHDLTNNFLVQVVGNKKVYLVNSLMQSKIYNYQNVYSLVDLSNPDLTKHPLMKDVDIIEIDLNAGQCLAIPIGWWHQVHSTSFSISITYTNYKKSNSWSEGQTTFSGGELFP
jgi:hypothetical protein